jgi:hypothetical protein
MPASAYSGPERRQYFRLCYPAGNRPTFATGGQVFPVCDVSERGLRFDKTATFPLKGWIRGKLSLICEVEFDIDGVVVRDGPGHIGIQFITTIPEAVLSDEQQQLEATHASGSLDA